MRLTREIKIGERTVKVVELTTGEIRAWMKESASSAGDVIDATLFDDFDLLDLRHLTDLKSDDLATMTPSEIRQVADLAKEVNADFFAMRRRIVTLGQSLLGWPLNVPSAA